MGLAVEATTSPLGLSKVKVPSGSSRASSPGSDPGSTSGSRSPPPHGGDLRGRRPRRGPGLPRPGEPGAGVKVAVIDLGFNGLSAAQAAGELPSSVITRDFTGTGIQTGISHGTAVAQIVHDVAPEAQLYLIKIGNEVDLDNAITYCISEGVHVINHSLGWFNTNFYDGTGTIAEIARRATAAGILWVQAAGNFAQRHYGATFTDGNGDGWHDVDVTLTATAGQQIILYLTWDAWPATADDYDLYLYGPTGALVASSTATQGDRAAHGAGHGDRGPLRDLPGADPAGGRGGPAAVPVLGCPRPLAGGGRLEPPRAGRRRGGPLGGGDRLAQLRDGPHRPYSSRGPTTDGRSKPDLVGPAGVATGVSTYNPFPGTSAAAPTWRAWPPSSRRKPRPSTGPA